MKTKNLRKQHVNGEEQIVATKDPKLSVLKHAAFLKRLGSEARQDIHNSNMRT